MIDGPFRAGPSPQYVYRSLKSLAFESRQLGTVSAAGDGVCFDHDPIGIPGVNLQVLCSQEGVSDNLVAITGIMVCDHMRNGFWVVLEDDQGLRSCILSKIVEDGIDGEPKVFPIEPDYSLVFPRWVITHAAAEFFASLPSEEYV